MLDYTTYKAEDFLLDESFLNYCRNISADKAFWKNFIEQNPGMLPEITHAKKLYSIVSITVSEEEKKMEADKLKSKISAYSEQTIMEKSSAPVYPVSTKIKKWLPGLAAAVIGIIISIALWYSITGNKRYYNTSVAEFTKARFEKVIRSGNNERKQVQLPDGSMVELNYGSTLKISDTYNQSQRWVYLEGEAFFTVTPDKEKPFVVITGKTATTALGTSFKVRNYDGEKVSNVMLATGRVKVQAMTNKNNREELILLPGEQATILKNNLFVKSTFNQEILHDWRTMKIVFDKANLDKIINTLEFYYGVKVVLQNKPRTEIAFTGKFSGQLLKDVLEAISFANKFKYTQTGNTIFILFNNRTYLQKINNL